MNSNALATLEELEIYATAQVLFWDEVRQRAEYGGDNYMRAAFVRNAYRDMAEKLAELGEIAR